VALSHIRKPISDWFVGGDGLTPLNATLNRIPCTGVPEAIAGTSNILKERERVPAFRPFFLSTEIEIQIHHSQKNSITITIISLLPSSFQITRSQNVNHNRR
jgi:hypothetical protein